MYILLSRWFPNERLGTTGSGGPPASNGAAAPLAPAALSPYSWPALRSALLRVAGQVSYASLLEDPELWADGGLMQGVLQLLRALGAHRHAQELTPLLGAYVGLLSDRIAAEPGELGCLEGLWDAMGLSCIVSLPAQAGKQRRPTGQGPLLTEASTCLALVTSLASQLSAATARQRLWQQVHRHLLPLLERCLGELARAVGKGQGPAAGKVAAAAKQQPQAQPEQERKGPGPEEVAAIVLVCQVLDFYVQQRPGNADLAAALKGSGVLASLAVLFGAAGNLPGAEPLRSAALCCGASSRELASWMLAVPGVHEALEGPAFKDGGAYEAHGAVWELLQNGGTSPLMLRILDDGAAPEKAPRVHALLQLLSTAAACRGGAGATKGLWSPAVDRALRDLYAALRERVTVPLRQGQLPAVPREANGAAGAVESEPDDVGSDGDEDDDEEKLRLLDPLALQHRRAKQLHPACWRMLKQLLSAGEQTGGKTD
ncbi:hypothetical protein GPECTOR_1g7 [Gonium pectorale]|uniref:Uncharacterized protein n=1 Tax=Gonium pectorale TaxID=33097 RepID=A0A150H3P5_GONPE|nr:hypothetical protein GPECTOR_1g7 [Gonium pectorale]|eukprot:KXZ56776.1 hypothetical protein GPECTOR_1g7 [Gonium pectorale]